MILVNCTSVYRIQIEFKGYLKTIILFFQRQYLFPDQPHRHVCLGEAHFLIETFRGKVLGTFYAQQVKNGLFSFPSGIQ